ncbi:hypothetical protein Tco_1239760 [Tanacetum coccineum]
MAPQHRECYDGLKKSYELEMDYFSSYDVYSLKRSRQDNDKDEDPSAGSDQGLKKRKRSKDAEPTNELKKKDSTSGSSKPQPKSSRMSVQSEEPVQDWFKKPIPQQEPADPDWNVGKTSQGPTFRLLKGIHKNFAELEYDFEECYKALSEKLDWENPKGDDYPFDLSKPLPLITRGKCQRVPFELFINNDLKYLQGGILTMTYTTSTTKIKAAQYDLPGIEDMVPNIWSPVKSFYAFARGMKSNGDVYSTKRILAVTHVSIMRKYRYGYLEEIVVRRADNVLYRFKKGDFPRLRINDIEDMLILMVQNRLSNLLRDDVADFVIALRMYTRSLVIQKRIEDLQLGVESYQKKINVTKPDTTRSDLRKRHPYTPYKDPQGFIYVDDNGRNRRWSTLEKKRAHFMIKDINKLLKERRRMRSLEKFVGGSIIPRLQDVEDLQGDDLLYYDAELELMNMILLAIPNEIYNSVDSCKTAKEMWARVERLMRGTIQNQVDRETRFTNEFDQFVAEPGESLVSVYNRFAQLMNDLERNNMKFPTVLVNTKFLNSLQPEWLK